MPTLNINGQRVKVGDDFLKLTPEQQNATVDEIASKLGAGGQRAAPATGPLSPGSAPASTAAPPVGPVDYLSQGLSGINEGIGNILGFPVDMTTLGINAATTGINKLTGTQIPQITDPVGGSDSIHKLMSPTIGPESSNPSLQMTRRVGQEIGAMTIPGAGPIVRSARPAMTFGKEMLAATGSGLGGAIAEQVAPGNALAEFGGQLVGGMTPGSLSRIAKRGGKPPAKTVDDLRADKNAAYAAVDNLGVAYSPQFYDNMLANIAQKVTAKNISPTRHEAAYSFISDMASRRGKPYTLTELDQLRQEVRRDLLTPSYGNQSKAADAYFGEIILEEIDDFIANAKPADLISGNPKDAANAILMARSLNTRLRKTEMVEDALAKATRQAESSGSGGNINNAIRQQFKAILNSPKKLASFTKDERAQMEKLVRQGKTEDLLRWVGKFSPGGNGLIGMLQVGGTILNPSIAALPVAGMVAKGIADKGTIKAAEAFQQRVATGAPPKTARPGPMVTKEMLDRQRALLLAQGANQNKPIEIVIRGGAR
jgi:hypothetical protein